jgi:hypothetical protein
MNCNACMSRSLRAHICREKCLEDNCPICHEYIFTSSSPVKALPCGHLMHSTCFQVILFLKILHFFFLHFGNIQANLHGATIAVARTTLVVTIPAQSAASHLGTCRSVTRYVPFLAVLATFMLTIYCCKLIVSGKFYV